MALPRLLKLSILLSIIFFALILTLAIITSAHRLPPSTFDDTQQTHQTDPRVPRPLDFEAEDSSAEVEQVGGPQFSGPPQTTGIDWSSAIEADNEADDTELSLLLEEGDDEREKEAELEPTGPDSPTSFEASSQEDTRSEVGPVVASSTPSPSVKPSPSVEAASLKLQASSVPRPSSSTTTTTRPTTASRAPSRLRSRSYAQNGGASLHSPSSGPLTPANRLSQSDLKQLLLKYLVQKAAENRVTLSRQQQSSPVTHQAMRVASSRIRQNAQAKPPSSSSSAEEDDDDDEDDAAESESRKAKELVYREPSTVFTPPPVTPRNLTSSSQRIAQLFQDLNGAESGRVSRFQPPTLSSASSNSPSSPLCGDVVRITTNYELSSPNYPEKYPPNTDCVWEISTAKDQNLRVQIFKLNLEKDKLCRFDYLDVKGVTQTDKKGASTVRTKRYCGTYINEEITIGANTTSIVFHSDASGESSGFHVRIIAESFDCRETLNVHNWTTVTSPRYPASYEDSKNCWTSLTAEPDHRLLVEFAVLKLEPDIRCALDYLEIYDSPIAEESRSLGKFCQFPENASLAVYSTGRHLLFHFVSDNFLALLGYKARITALRTDVDIDSYSNCNWTADWTNMTITSPFYPKPYPAGAQCETSISAFLPDERIIILFDWIDLVDDEGLSRKSGALAQLSTGRNPAPSLSPSPAAASSGWVRFNCSADRLEIWESVNDTEPSNVFCGFRSQPFKYVSKGRSIRLVFKSADGDDAQASDSRPDDAKSRRRAASPSSSSPLPSSLQSNLGFKARFTFIDSNTIPSASAPSHTKSDASSLISSPLPDNSSPAPLPTLLRRPLNATVSLGSSHILYCELDADSRPSTPIVWFKGDREIHEGLSSDGSSLLIRQFSPSSVGRYICVYGDSSADAWLTLNPDTGQCGAPSSVLFHERPRDQFTSEGEFVMLHCRISTASFDSKLDAQEGEEKKEGGGALGQPKITWERVPLHYTEGESMSPRPVELSSRIKLLHRGDLLFDPALAEDSGFYFCSVQITEGGERNKPNSASSGCSIKSAARVQINQRIDVSQVCGVSHLGRKASEPKKIADIGKIIGGTEAAPGEFPWMVMFWDEKRHVFCGGVLINERWVVTAAHCFTDISDEATVFVKLGKYDQTASESTEIGTKIQHVIKHPHFSNETFDNDIALVKLVQHIAFTEYIAPICMPASTEEVNGMNAYFFGSDGDAETSPGTASSPGSGGGESDTKFGYVTGWGRLKENGPLPRYLHKIRLPIVEEERCRRSTAFKVTENMFCAGYGKEIVGDACKGDSGGPFAVQFENRWTLLGLVSWGEGCSRLDKFGFYTRVTNYGNWIRRLTRHN